MPNDSPFRCQSLHPLLPGVKCDYGTEHTGDHMTDVVIETADGRNNWAAVWGGKSTAPPPTRLGRLSEVPGSWPMELLALVVDVVEQGKLLDGRAAEKLIAQARGRVTE